MALSDGLQRAVKTSVRYLFKKTRGLKTKCFVQYASKMQAGYSVDSDIYIMIVLKKRKEAMIDSLYAVVSIRGSCSFSTSTSQKLGFFSKTWTEFL